MKYLSLIFLCAMAAAQCTPTTPNLGLAIPPYNDSGWNTCINNNFTILDNYLSGVNIFPAFKVAGLTVSGTGLTSNTGAFSGNVTIGGSLTVTGSLVGSLSLTNLSLSGTLGVTGTSTLGNASLSGTLGVAGVSTLAAVSATTGAFSGQVTSSLATGTAPLSIASTTSVANLTVSNHPTVIYCGGSPACTNTQETGGKVIFGQVTLSGGTRTVTGISGISTIIECTATDVSNANLASLSSLTNTGFVVTGTGADTVAYVCVGF